MARVYLGLGSNVDAEKQLRFAVSELRRRFGPLDLSPVYRSRAVGFEGDDFLNMVVGLDTRDGPEDLHAELESIHVLSGRKRGGDRYASRCLDIDMLLYEDLVHKAPPLKLPRRDILEYDFVLKPLAELAPGLPHPETGRTMAEHWQNFDGTNGIVEVVPLVF